jgi:hypothetical protein
MEVVVRLTTHALHQISISLSDAACIREESSLTHGTIVLYLGGGFCHGK